MNTSELGRPNHQTTFSCMSLDQDDCVVVMAAGELDLATADRLWQELSRGLSRSALVVMDCSMITFCDSSGLNVLVRTRNTAAKAQATFALAGVPDRLAEVLKASGLSKVLPAFPDVAAAHRRTFAD